MQLAYGKVANVSLKLNVKPLKSCMCFKNALFYLRFKIVFKLTFNLNVLPYAFFIRILIRNAYLTYEIEEPNTFKFSLKKIYSVPKITQPYRPK